MPEAERKGEGVLLRLDEDETELMRRLIEEMRLLLDADIPESDAIIGRLFPRAYEDDEEQAAFAEMTHDPLRQARRETLTAVEASLGPAEMELSGELLDSWLRLLTDMRVAIGTRLEVDEERMSQVVDPHDPDAPALSVLHWLGWVQGILLEELGHP